MATQETYSKLKELLDQEKFPKPYVFKFIIKRIRIKKMKFEIALTIRPKLHLGRLKPENIQL